MWIFLLIRHPDNVSPNHPHSPIFILRGPKPSPTLEGWRHLFHTHTTHHRTTAPPHRHAARQLSRRTTASQRHLRPHRLGCDIAGNVTPCQRTTETNSGYGHGTHSPHTFVQITNAIGASGSATNSHPTSLDSRLTNCLRIATEAKIHNHAHCR